MINKKFVAYLVTPRNNKYFRKIRQIEDTTQIEDTPSNFPIIPTVSPLFSYDGQLVSSRNTEQGLLNNQLESLSAYEVKNNSFLFERLFKVKKNGVFLFRISFFVLEIFTFL